jgi:methyl-accepting chemotaxis protein
LSSPSYIAKPVLTPRDAIASHVRWKIALQLAAQLREPLSERATRSITHIEECANYKWLVSEHTRDLRGTTEYRAVVQRHAAFHDQMRKVANLLQAADFDSAARLVNQPGPFQDASNALANAIMSLEGPRRSASIPHPIMSHR